MLALIPAKQNSTRLKNKNLKLLNGKPLIYYSIKAALKSKYISRVIVSTDSKIIAKKSLAFGAEVPFIRPKNISKTDTTIKDVCYHAFKFLEKKEKTKIKEVIVLQPTSPVRDLNLIDTCINKFKDGGYTNLATGFYTKIKEYGTHNNTRRQDYKGFFYDDGNVYILDKKLAMEGIWCGINPCKFPIARHMNYEIDDEVDFIIVESLLKINKK